MSPSLLSVHLWSWGKIAENMCMCVCACIVLQKTTAILKQKTKWTINQKSWQPFRCHVSASSKGRLGIACLPAWLPASLKLKTKIYVRATHVLTLYMLWLGNFSPRPSLPPYDRCLEAYANSGSLRKGKVMNLCLFLSPNRKREVRNAPQNAIEKQFESIKLFFGGRIKGKQIFAICVCGWVCAKNVTFAKYMNEYCSHYS